MVRGDRPAYPSDAIQQRIQGKVILKVALDEKGEVTDVRVVSGSKEFISPAVEAVQKWHFAPDAGQTDVITVTISFLLG